MGRIAVALGPDFLSSFSRVPKGQQKKVREFIEKFQSNPKSPGINYERIKNAADPKFRSVRIDKAYRAIVVAPPKGDVYMLAWVDHHDKAYSWAMKRRVEVNPTLGHVQVYIDDPNLVPTVQPVTPVAEDSPASSPSPQEPVGLFSDVSDDALDLFGVPAVLIPAVRAVEDRRGLEKLSQHLPVDVNDALSLLADGKSYDQVIDELDRREQPTEPIDTDDFLTALKKPESKRVFAEVDQQSLAEMLTAPLEQWRIFLHPDQQKVVEWDVAGPSRVLGGAGTGKTVALMHRAAHLAKKLDSDETILVTTYTRNLAIELEGYLKDLCGDNFHKVEVINLNAWASRFMNAQGIRFELATRAELEKAWEVATMGAEHLPEFYQDEWDKVVQANDITERRDYLRVRRSGRGTQLSRKGRSDVWEVFAKFKGELDRRGKVEFADIIREARLHLEANPGLSRYTAVLADEIQDFRDADLKLLRALAKPGRNDMFLVGDPHQRIYGHRGTFKSCGIDIVGRSRRLKVNYRTTSEIGSYATRVLKGLTIDDMDGGIDELNGYRALRNGEQPIVRHFQTENQEAEFVVSTIRDWLSEPGIQPNHICLTAPNKKLRDRYSDLLSHAGIKCVTVDRNTPEAKLAPDAVRLSTMHRMKGLEFPRVLIADSEMAQREMPDQAASEDRETSERCLRYVAATRARDVLAVASFGEPTALTGAGSQVRI